MISRPKSSKSSRCEILVCPATNFLSPMCTSLPTPTAAGNSKGLTITTNDNQQLLVRNQFCFYKRIDTFYDTNCSTLIVSCLCKY